MHSESHPINYNEPSEELQKLADSYVKRHQFRKIPRNQLMSHWCEYLGRKAPEVLDLPVMQLVKAIVRASIHHDQLQATAS